MKFYEYLHSSSLFFKLFQFQTKKNLCFFALSTVFIFCSGIFDGITSIFIFGAFSVLNGSYANNSMEKIVSFLKTNLSSFEFVDSDNFIFLLFLILVLACQLSKSFFSFFSLIFLARFSNTTQIILTKKYCNQLYKLPFSYISSLKSGELTSVAKVPFDSLLQYLTNIFGIVQNSIMCFSLLIVLLYISVSFTSIVLGLLTIGYFIQRKNIKHMHAISREYSSDLNTFMTFFSQVITGIRVIFSFHKFTFVKKRTNQLIDSVFATHFCLARKGIGIQPLNEILAILVVTVCAIIGFLILGAKNTSNIPYLITYLTMLSRFANRVPALMQGLGGLTSTSGELERLLHFIEEGEKNYFDDGEKRLPHFEQNIIFQQVAHTFDKREYVLQNCDIEIRKGTTVAFVGHSGAGKSTIIDLLLGFYTPQKGVILIDGTPLPELAMESWRSQIGVVSQDVFIFNDTVLNNIIFGEEGITKEQLALVAHISGCDRFIDKLPDKFNTILGERGYKLSGGERQRIALARALLKNPEIIILDEATSALDTKTEVSIINALGEFFGQKTMIVVAHRLSTIVHADEIIVLEGGEVTERGNHSDLITRGGIYFSMWEAQTRHKNEKAELVL